MREREVERERERGREGGSGREGERGNHEVSMNGEWVRVRETLILSESTTENEGGKTNRE